MLVVVVVILIRKLAGPHPLHLSYSCGGWILLSMDPHILFDILGTFVSVRLTFLWYLRLLQLYPVPTLENTSIWVIQHSYPGPFSHKHRQVKSSFICSGFLPTTDLEEERPGSVMNDDRCSSSLSSSPVKNRRYSSSPLQRSQSLYLDEEDKKDSRIQELEEALEEAKQSRKEESVVLVFTSG